MTIVWRALAIALACVGVLAAWWVTRKSESSSARPPGIEIASSTKALDAPVASPSEPGKPMSGAHEPRRTPTAAPIEIRGFVLDASGLPKARAELKSYPDGQPLIGTDENGEFLIALRGASMTFVGTDGALFSPPILVTANDTQRSIMVRLQEPTDLKIVVVEAATRRPIRAADVVVHRDGEFLAQTLTDEAGAASISIPAGGSVLLTGIAPGHAKVSRRVTMSAGSGGLHSVTLALPSGVRLEGSVVQENGSPAAGAAVTAWDATHIPIGTAMTDASGRFSLEGLYPGTFDIRALAEGAGSATLESVRLSEPGRTVSLRLVRGLSVFGVVMGADRLPVPEASVYLSPSAGFGVQQRRTVTSDANGRFEFVAVADAEVAVWATLGTRASETIRARPENAPVTLQLADLLGISGYVKDSSGNRLPNVLVTASRASSDAVAGAALGARATSADDGTFVLTGLAAGDWELTAVSADNLYGGAGAAEAPRVRAAAGQSGVVLEVAGTGAIEGWAEFEDGSIPEDLTVLLSGLRVANPSGGSFLLQGIPAGEHELVLTGPDFRAREVSPVQVRAGETTNLEGIVVERGRALEGVVRDSNGQPIAGATVASSRMLSIKPNSVSSRRLEEEPDIRVTQTDPAGRYHLSGLADGEMSIIAEHPNHGRSKPTPIGSQRSLDLTLRPTEQIEGIVSRNGEPSSGSAVVAESVGGRARFTAVTSASGRYMIPGMPPDEYTLTAVNRSGGAPELQRRHIVVKRGAALRFDIEFPAQTGARN
jgi:hypothetical protein